MPFEVEVEPREEENPARTKHGILKSENASFSQSVFSVPIWGKIVPNRDYPYEGLSLIVDGENWHILDGVALGFGDEIRSTKVILRPWKLTYVYSCGKHLISVDYFLMDVGDGAALIMNICSSKRFEIHIEPLMDIRRAELGSIPDGHWCRFVPHGLIVGSREKDISALIKCPEAKTRETNREVDWYYKLGSGFRRMDGSFIGENRKLVSLGELQVKSSSAEVIVACGRDVERVLRGAYWKEYEEACVRRAKNVVRKIGERAALRALPLLNFGIRFEGMKFLEAGDFWFRSVWVRDLAEALLNSFYAFSSLGLMKEVKRILLNVLSYERNGLIPHRLPDDFNSADSTFLTYILGFKIAEKSKDLGMGKKIMDLWERAMKSLNGNIRLLENGLISTLAWYSWTDTLCFIDGRKRPTRIPREWDYDEKPIYLLPEINAQWIACLKESIKLGRMIGRNVDEYDDLLEKAQRSFISTFCSSDFLYNVVTTHGEKDPTVGSPAVVAICMLSDILDPGDYVDVIKNRLLVYRKGLPFGILVKESEKRVYHGDEEYHEGVVWPRDTPYLISILRKVGEHRMIEEILESNLDHQMSEGFIYYNSELFSPDGGEMIPVKNPVQLWSQWVDPFLGKSIWDE